MILVFDFTGSGKGEQTGREGDVFVVLKREERGWVLVRREEGGEPGYLPRGYVRVVEEVGDLKSILVSFPSHTRRGRMTSTR